MKCDVAIIGAGPSGLLLAHLLQQAGLEPVVLERRSMDYVLGRIRAGVLEKTTTELLERLGLDARMKAEGLIHDGFHLADGENLIRIDLAELTGSSVMVYGQSEVQQDLIDAIPQRGLNIVWEAEDVTLHNVDSDSPSVTYSSGGESHTLNPRFIAGCDGFHGPSRKAIPASAGTGHERVYPFGWLGILADVPPCDDELIYANHANGFALASMRSQTRSRYYIQAPLDTNLDDWSDDRIWDELAIRLGPDAGSKITRGPSIEKSIAPLRSFVFEPMKYGSLFLAGDAAHIVPPTGAKGLNLAASDVIYLSDALIAFFKSGDKDALDKYSARALARIWKSERFSWYLTSLMHQFPEHSSFEREMQRAELDYIANSRAARESIAENYIGLPL
ncbi:4-hydroxybenzoate 3-monooxygenase [Maricaulis parjimensis]|uniref:4-hydroxybenzoate 3-monooxygenase n=1 Tax=Maricaulis parjimensis TaxID=144023 RepID=UPI0019392F3F|nr:4-hydroxybenzoate 3-monooxygenase [Maricaulis parjimensis]